MPDPKPKCSTCKDKKRVVYTEEKRKIQSVRNCPDCSRVPAPTAEK